MRIDLRWLMILVLLVSFAGPFSWLQAAAQSPTASTNAPANSADSASARQAYQLPPDKLAKAIAINRIRNVLDIVAGLWGIAVLWLLLASRGAAKLEAWASRLASRAWLHGILYFAALLILLTIADLPIDVYGHHVSRAYGISIQPWAGWLADQSKALGLTLLLGVPVLLFFNWIVRRWPQRYWFGIWLALLPILAASVYLAPLFEPLFNTYEPLAKNHPALVQKLEEVVARTGTKIPPQRRFLMIASAKTNGLNAYVDGIGATKRIVVWDTTAGRIPDDEIMFIFGHESGHYVLNHLPKGLAITAVGAFFICWLCAALGAALSRRFAVRWQLSARQTTSPGAPSFGGTIAKAWETTNPVPLGSSASSPHVNPLSTRAGFTVLILAFTIVSFLIEPVANTISRHFEHQADIYGQEAIHNLVPNPQKTAIAAFNALGEAWLEDPNPNPLIEFWEYNHPSVKNRANFAAHYNPWANGGHGEFFQP